jgi:hypothetical protein
MSGVRGFGGPAARARAPQCLLGGQRAEDFQQQAGGCERREVVDQVQSHVEGVFQQQDHEYRQRHQPQPGEGALPVRDAAGARQQRGAGDLGQHPHRDQHDPEP